MTVPRSADLTPAVLIYNAGSGQGRRTTPDELRDALWSAGFDARHRPTAHADDLQAALADVTGPVFVAGGDGTFRAAALQLVGRAGVTVGVIPLGTSNNIARTLGLDEDPLALAGRYRNGLSAPFDAGRIRAPWGEDLFFEACGCGVFADVLHAYDPDAPKSPLRAVGALMEVLPDFEPLDLQVTVAGELHPGPPLTLLEVMNIQATSNSLRLAPDAHPGDGLLNLIRVNGEERDGLLAYVASLLGGTFDDLPSVREHVTPRLQVSYHGQVFHVDGETRAPGPPGGAVDIEVWPAALQVLRPAGG